MTNPPLSDKVRLPPSFFSLLLQPLRPPPFPFLRPIHANLTSPPLSQYRCSSFSSSPSSSSSLRRCRHIHIQCIVGDANRNCVGRCAKAGRTARCLAGRLVVVRLPVVRLPKWEADKNNVYTEYSSIHDKYATRTHSPKVLKYKNAVVKCDVM